MKYKGVTYDMFGGENAEALNALYASFCENAGGRDEIYKWLEETPKTSMIVELLDQLQKMGYTITFKK